jgi:uncharacterized membrane protein YcaP (DUF421 family)
MAIWEILLRTVCAFLVLLFWSRILGKKLVSQMTFFDFITGVTFGAIGGNVIFNKRNSLTVDLLVLSLFALMALLADFISLKSIRGRRILQSEPKTLIRNGTIDRGMMSKNRLTFEDLLMHLRKKDVFHLDEVNDAFFETDGSISVIKKPAVMPVVRKDIHVTADNRGVPRTLIMDGHILDKSLAMIGKDRKWLVNTLRDAGAGDVHDVMVAQIDQLGTFTVKMK